MSRNGTWGILRHIWHACLSGGGCTVSVWTQLRGDEFNINAVSCFGPAALLYDGGRCCWRSAHATRRRAWASSRRRRTTTSTPSRTWRSSSTTSSPPTPVRSACSFGVAHVPCRRFVGGSCAHLRKCEASVHFSMGSHGARLRAGSRSAPDSLQVRMQAGIFALKSCMH